MTASTPSTARSTASGSRTSAWTQSASSSGFRIHQVARTCQLRSGASATSVLPSVPAPPVTRSFRMIRSVADGKQTLMAQPQEEGWPTVDQDTLVAPPPAPPPVPPPADRRIGAGMLLGLGAIALVAVGLVLAFL